ncbi:hypothetical protein ACFLT2_08435 [Acidobacteriota bacterium]
MKRKSQKFWPLIGFLLLLCPYSVFSQTIGIRGMLFGWLTANFSGKTEGQLGVRYLPELSFEKSLPNSSSLDAMFSLSAYGTSLFRAEKETITDSEVDLYRLWLRYASSQFEVRVGLQKINFGSAALFRPLMWFDQIDPRDPLQITKGVYGLLGRYYFLNNANIWAWVLYGNNDAKGWEFIGTKDKSIEYGGRIQTPLFKGEIAFSYHHRRADISKSPYFVIPEIDPIIPEDRFALDGKWDIGVGFWFEGVLIRQDTDVLPYTHRHLLTIGLDYTFGLGNGLHVMGEHFIQENSDKAFVSGEGSDFSAFSINYPLGILDNLSGILFYDWINKELYRYISWQRTYDNWRFYVIGFWNPEQLLIYPERTTHTLFAGKGFQLMIVFNH